jgi:hypothetical protein
VSLVYVFICTKQTYPLSVPQYTINQADHYRKVHNAFAAIGSGFRRVGDLVLRPTADAFDDHLLCDGSTLNRDSFPQLAAYLSPGTDTFTLPNYLTGLTFASSAPVQTVSEGGTVSTGGAVITPTDPGQTGGTTGGNVSSGGRPRNPFEQIP